MAKKNHIQPVEAASTAKKPLKVTSTAKKTSEVASTSKKNKQSEPLKNRLPESSNDEEDEPTKDCNKKNPETTTESESKAESESTEPASTKTPAPATVSTSASPNKKRQSEEEKAKKKGTFDRVWSENDEIVLLQGMIDFENETGESPYANMSGFHQVVKNSISFDVKSGKQFSSKIWSLRKKYLGKRKNGSFTKPHDMRCLELAKTIWGADLVKAKKKIKLEDDSLKIDGVKLQQGWFEKSFLVPVITDLGVDEETLKEKWSLVPVKTKKRLEEKFMSLQANQLKCVFQKTDLLNEVSHVMVKVD